LRVGVFKFTSCSGCQMVLVNLEENLLDLLRFIDLRYFRMVTDDNLPSETFDVAIAEGAISNEEEALFLKKLRRSFKVLVAAGSCAVTGGVNAMKNTMPQGDVEKAVYTSPETIRSGKAFGLNEYVPVDIYLNGCPVDMSELVQALISFIHRVPPYTPGVTVCVECKMRGNNCLFLTKKEPCLGPVTRGGCNATCPSNSVACEGCRGMLVGTNLDALALAWTNLGMGLETILRMLRKYGGFHPSFAR